MHMADALLSPAVGGVMYAASAGAIGWAVKKIDREQIGEKKLPLMAVSGAFVFAAQMVNFSIPGTGSSGHIGGGVLLAGLLGGAPALPVLAAVLAVQCLLFADGGLLALGANIFNMGVIPCIIVWPLVYRPILRNGITTRRLWCASVLSAVLGLQLGAFAVVLETVFSGVTELLFSTFVALMQPIHLAIGLAEGIVTAGVLFYVHKTRPELIESAVTDKTERGVPMKRTVIVLAALAVIIGGGFSLLASSDPDGLEWSMEHTAGTADLKRDGGIYSATASAQDRIVLLPDYDFAEGDGSGTAISGLVGAAATCVLAGGIGLAITLAKAKRKKEKT